MSGVQSEITRHAQTGTGKHNTQKGRESIIRKRCRTDKDVIISIERHSTSFYN